MDMDDFRFLHSYFSAAGRDPTETEIRVLDTYWSDHCRHTTFNTALTDIEIEEGPFSADIRESLEGYRELREDLYSVKTDRPVTLMDMAVIGAKYLKKQGFLDDIELSDEINACSIYIDVYTESGVPSESSVPERWLLMFKNETHNHPTEIEPFGGAATCIGGAIRDPLSGRAWVYQSMRVSGAADPRTPLSHTLPGKLPQLKLVREAAAGFSSYGNQIGLTTGQVTEIYHTGFAAKRMELGAVIAAAPAEAVIRETPEPGDIVILVGGGTGRDGIGGATGSSRAHTEESVSIAGAEVQKGNAVEERKLQRLFRNRDAARLIRRCNDFGAGGVAVAVGELAPGLEIDLDAVPRKYEGLNGTELAISESQERMAVVVRPGDAETFINAAAAENLNAAPIARVTGDNRLVMKWRGNTIVDIERSFLDTAGAPKSARCRITSPDPELNPLGRPLASVKAVFDAASGNGMDEKLLEDAWLENLRDLACASQRGLQERFDGSIGAGSVLFPFGGAYQGTPEAGMAAKIPVLPPAEARTCSIMTFGYDPRISSWSPWHGAQIAVLSSLAKLAALGGDPEKARLTFQEYFEKTATPEAWGKPAAALLGALSAQKAMKTAAIGGKDSMSGTFGELTVPPTLVSFAVGTEDCSRVISGALKQPGSAILYIPQPYGETGTPDFAAFRDTMRILRELNGAGKIRAAYPVGPGGIAEALSKMAFGNRIGFALESSVPQTFFLPSYGSLIIEAEETLKDNLPAGWRYIGYTIEEEEFRIAYPAETGPDGSALSPAGIAMIPLSVALDAWESSLAEVFPPSTPETRPVPEFAGGFHTSLTKGSGVSPNGGAPQGDIPRSASFYTAEKAAPEVLLPVFPGTNCEYDMFRAFSLAGAKPKIVVFRNNTPAALAESLQELAREIGRARIFALSGGFSAGDEPDGSGKYIAAVLREGAVRDAVMDLIQNRDGLLLGICNGFQAFIKTGLVPYGEIREPAEEMPTLTFNTLGRHISRIVRTQVVSSISPWTPADVRGNPGNPAAVIHSIPISHGEGRVIISEGLARALFASGQVFTRYVDIAGNPAEREPDNPNGTAYAIEGLTSADGRILGKMGHGERVLERDIGDRADSRVDSRVGSRAETRSSALMKNIPGNRYENIFEAGVSYYV
jgi:phosphoribosylformylglycinamidine synthase